jgi:hypothetical protein
MIVKYSHSGSYGLLTRTQKCQARSHDLLFTFAQTFTFVRVTNGPYFYQFDSNAQPADKRMPT